MAIQTNSRQIPDHAIVDFYNKQAYLGNQFSYAVQTTSSGTSETAQILLANSITNAQTTIATPKATTLFLRNIHIAGGTAGQEAVVNVYVNSTTTSAGTPQTPINVRPNSSTTSISTLTTAPTMSSNGNLVHSMACAGGSSDNMNQCFVIDPGAQLLITVTASASSTKTSVSLTWYEL